MQLLAVNYHYFRDTTEGKGIYPISKRDFSSQLDVISKHYEFINQEMLVSIVSKGAYPNKRYCILTFDDGLKEQMEACEILIQKGIGGIFHIITDTLEQKEVINIHKIHYIRSKMDDNELLEVLQNDYDIFDVNFDRDILNAKYPYDNDLAKKIKYFLTFVLNDFEREKTINALFDALVNNEDQFLKQWYMNDDDIMKLAKYKMLGTHSSSHRPLAKLKEEEMRYDIKKSINYLETITRETIHAISYPYGIGEAVSERLSQIAVDAGLSIGFTVIRGINQNEDYQNFLFLKRINTNEAPGGKLNRTEYM